MADWQMVNAQGYNSAYGNWDGAGVDQNNPPNMQDTSQAAGFPEMEEVNYASF